MANESGPITVGDLSNRRIGWGRGAAIGLLLAGVVGLVFYVCHYQSEREIRRQGRKVETNHEPYLKVRAAFVADLDAGRLDSAYVATTNRYRMSTGRVKFDALAKRYLAFKKRPGARNEAGESPHRITLDLSGILNKDAKRSKDEKPAGYEVFACDFWKAEDGARLRVSVTVAQLPDSFFYREPPPLGVDSFGVDYVNEKGEDVAPPP